MHGFLGFDAAGYLEDTGLERLGDQGSWQRVNRITYWGKLLMLRLGPVE